MFETDEIVWVKPKSYPWWPAQVLDRELWPKAKGRPLPSITCVKYLDEYSYEPVNNVKNIQPFLCPMRMQYQAVGLKCRDSKAFRKALDEALEIVGVSETESPPTSPEPADWASQEVTKEPETFASSVNGSHSERESSELQTRGGNCGPHQAVIAKCGLEVGEESQTLNNDSYTCRRHEFEASMGSQPLVEKAECETLPPSPSYTCEFCGYMTSRLNNKVRHDKVCSPTRGKRREEFNGDNCTPTVLSLAPEGELNSDSFCSDFDSWKSSKGSKRKGEPSELERNSKGKKRSRPVAQGHKLSAARTSASVACNTGTPLSKQGALQKLQEAVKDQEVGFNSKRVLFEKDSGTKTPHNGKTGSSAGRKKGLRKSTAESKTNEYVTSEKSNRREKLSSVFRLPSDTSLLLTPDPVKLEGMPDLGDVSQSISTRFDENLHEDTCGSESEDELPEGLSPIKHEFQLSDGDIVWAKVKGWPYWPAVIRKFYPERRKARQPAKASLLFINDGLCEERPGKRVFSVRCTNSRGKTVVFPFTSSEREKFEKEAYMSKDWNLIEGAIRHVDDYLTKKGLGLIRSNAHKFFFPSSPEPLDYVDEKEDLILGMGKRDRVYSVDFEGNGTSNGEQMFADSEENDNTSDGEQGEITLSEVQSDADVSETMKARNKQRKQRCENLVEFIKSEKMKKYLANIFHGKRASALHSSYYGSLRERNKLRNPGFGPISDEEQRSEILDTLLSWLVELKESVAENVDYTMDVWVPEAIVYALISVKKYSRGRAWALFHKGIRFTKEEYGKAHKAILEAAERISPEDKEMYERKLQEKIQDAMWAS